MPCHPAKVPRPPKVVVRSAILPATPDDGDGVFCDEQTCSRFTVVRRGEPYATALVEIPDEQARSGRHDQRRLPRAARW
jgi:hypothetical protein